MSIQYFCGDSMGKRDSLAMRSIRLHRAPCPGGRGEVPHHADDFMAVESEAGSAGICGLLWGNCELPARHPHLAPGCWESSRGNCTTSVRAGGLRLWLRLRPSANELWCRNCHCGHAADPLRGSPGLAALQAGQPALLRCCSAPKRLQLQLPNLGILGLIL